MTSEQRITILVALQNSLDDTAKCRDNAKKELEETGDPYWQESMDYWEKSHERFMAAYNAI